MPPRSNLYIFVCVLVVSSQEILEGVTDIDLVINLKLREEALLAKCLGRRICSECGGNYNVACIDIKGENGNPGMYMGPLLPPPHCASKLITRSDDKEEVVRERLRIYNEKVFSNLHCSMMLFSSSFFRDVLEYYFKATFMYSNILKYALLRLDN